MIPYGRQSIDDSDVSAVVAALKSDWLTQGPAVPRFEQALTAACGARHAVAVTNATAALHVACRALGLGPGDLLWTSANTFVASANCARYCGADVDFVDIDERTYNISVAALTEKLERAERAGRLPKIVIPVHFAGQSCEMRAIAALAARFGFRVIEDASHAVGGSYVGEPIGNCRYSDVVVFSFHPVKIVTTAEGGAALCNDDGLAERMRLLRSHGMVRDPVRWADRGAWYYEQTELGYNYRLTDLQAALGFSQLQRLGSFVARRRQIAVRYDEALTHSRLTLPWQHPDSASAYHLYPIRVLGGESRCNRRVVYDGLRTAGIGVNVHYIPVYTQPYYRHLGFGDGYCPASESYYAEAISLPMFPGLTDADQDRVIATLLEQLA